jgi:hypothetical protein
VFGSVCAALALSLSLPLAVHDAGVARTYIVSHALGIVWPTDFLNYYTAGRTLLDQPAALYAPDQEAARQRTLTGQDNLYAQFQNMPQVALFFVPLAVLPYGLAYLLWGGLNLAALAAAAWLSAPRLGRWPSWASAAIWVGLVLVGYAPAQLALIDGQTTLLALFGLCAWVAACTERGQPRAAGSVSGGTGDAARASTVANIGRGALWLLTWAWKPQLLPMPLLALVLSRAARRAALLVGLQLLALALVIVWVGPGVLERYVTLTRRAAGEYASGQTVFGIAQALGGPAALSAAVALFGAALVCALVASMWWGGLRADSDARRLLQFASLPLAAVLLAPRAYAYELTLWLASAWLILRYVLNLGEQHGRWPLLSTLALSWLAAVLLTLSSGDGVPWAALSGMALLTTLVWQYRWANPAP